MIVMASPEPKHRRQGNGGAADVRSFLAKMALNADTATLVDSAISSLSTARSVVTFHTAENAAIELARAYSHGNLLADHLTALADTGTDIDDSELTDPTSWQAKLREYLNDMSTTTSAGLEAPFHTWRGSGNEKWNASYPENNPLNMASIYNENIKLYLDFQNITIRLQETQMREKKKAEADEKIRLEVEAKEKAKAKIIAENKDKAIKDMLARVILLEETVKEEELSLEDLKRNSAPLIDLIDNKPLIDKSDQIYEELLTREANGIAKAAEIRAEIEKFRGTRNGR
jgi:hypothetical protein